MTYEITKAEVVVVQEDEVMSVQTHADTVEDVLDELDIDVSKHDDLSHNLDDPITADMEIEHTIANQVTVSIDGEKEKVYSTADTVDAFLEEQGIKVEEYDDLSVNREKAINNGLDVQIEKAVQVTLVDAGEEEKIWTTADTIAELLEQKQVEISDLDRVEPEQEKELESNMKIDITRVEVVTDVVEEKVDYAVVRRNDSSLQKGKEKVVASGEEGMIEKHYKVTLENGEEVSRELVKEEVKKESKQRVVAVGTKTPPPSPSTNNQAKSSEPVSRGSDNAVKTLYMSATAYNWNCDTCDGRGFTATGYNLKANPNGVVAVDPNVIPLGTKVWVEGYGYAIARDTGGAIKGNKIDIHLPSKQQAERYGRKQVQVKILE